MMFFQKNKRKEEYPQNDEIQTKRAKVIKKKLKKCKQNVESILLPSKTSKSDFQVEIINKKNEKPSIPIDKNTGIEMLSWSIVPLPEPILKALAEQKFMNPTQIQLLTLPPAILGIY